MAAPDDPRSSRVRFGLIAITLLTGAVQCWRYRHSMYPDGSQYLDIAGQFTREGVPGLMNGYWSPLYPALLALVGAVLHPTRYWLYPSVQLVNLLAYVAAVFAFDTFLRSVLVIRACRAATDRLAWLSPAAVGVAAYASFLVTIAYMLNVRTMSPDMMVAAAIFLVSARLLDEESDDARLGRWIVIGVALAIGYYAKAVMFPIAVVYLLVALILQRVRRRAMRGCVVAAAVFVALVTPWIVGLSISKARPTFGDTGSINFAWYVNGWAFNLHWIGEPPESGVPAHPVQHVFARPDTFAFDWPRAVTYPPFYDPSYWTEGIQTRIRLADERRAFARTASEFVGILRSGFLLLGPILAALIALAPEGRRWIRRWPKYAAVWLPAIVAIGLYMAVHIEGRLVAAQLQVLVTVTLATLAYDELWVRRVERTGAAAIVAAAVLTVGPVTGGAIRHVVRDVRAGEANEPQTDWRVAQALAACGLAPGDRIAVIGNVLDVTWAQLAALSIVAEISRDDLPAYLSASPETHAGVLETFHRLGVRVVARSLDLSFDHAPWTRIAGTEFAVLGSER
jgi:4-amino-4-deoxy-L-arabinose transferase-like glycosyltransferase